MSTRREGRARANDRQRREKLRSERQKEAELIQRLHALLSTDADGECRGLVLKLKLSV